MDAEDSDNHDSEDPRAIVYTARGRTLIRRGRGYESLTRDWWGGWRFKATKLSESYTMEDCLADANGAGDLVLASMPNGKFALLGPGREAPGGPGTVIIRFAPPEASDA